ncbi:acyl-CoA N-acyltransferase [Coprinopsis marcescibilis]|uniref:Acyl-CoA N-acyltransferase n=1 Tax=Coprinopsis marcescibilis TaxID=230819 RepID=A0A5C3L1T9_COPMA|nr:acyl-CoA N-acyltransferase [Coprinopsis marcescibilis]
MSRLAENIAPCERNPQTKEIFLRLRKNPNIILTPPRATTDAPKIAEYLQDPRIYEFLVSPPVPYLLEHAESWLARVTNERQPIVDELDEGRQVVGGCPFQYLREVKPDGTDELIGSIDLTRCPFGHLMGNGAELDWENAEANAKINMERPAGDPEIVWTIGDWLAPSHHGKGIMTDAVDTLLNDWGVRMNLHRVIVSAFPGNIGSIKVFQKNGFRTTNITDDAIEVRGTKRGLHTLEWRLKTVI